MPYYLKPGYLSTSHEPFQTWRLFTNIVRTSKKTQGFTTARIDVYYENHRKHIDALRGQNEDLLNGNSRGT